MSVSCVATHRAHVLLFKQVRRAEAVELGQAKGPCGLQVGGDVLLLKRHGDAAGGAKRGVLVTSAIAGVLL